MASFKFDLSHLLLVAALVSCSKKESSEPPAAAPSPPPPPAATTPESESMTPAAGTTVPDTSESGPAATTAPEPMAPAAEALTDEQILKLLDLANSAEVEEGRFAQTRAKNPKVRNFASKMIMRHGQAKQKSGKLATKLAMTPAESSLSTKMKSESESALADLKATPPADFDRAYMDAQVEEHRKVLSTIDDKLMPAARSPELQSLLQEMRTTVQSHLTEAQQIQSDLAK